MSPPVCANPLDLFSVTQLFKERHHVIMRAECQHFKDAVRGQVGDYAAIRISKHPVRCQPWLLGHHPSAQSLLLFTEFIIGNQTVFVQQLHLQKLLLHMTSARWRGSTPHCRAYCVDVELVKQAQGFECLTQPNAMPWFSTSDDCRRLLPPSLVLYAEKSPVSAAVEAICSATLMECQRFTNRKIRCRLGGPRP